MRRNFKNRAGKPQTESIVFLKYTSLIWFGLFSGNHVHTYIQSIVNTWITQESDNTYWHCGSTHVQTNKQR